MGLHEGYTQKVEIVFNSLAKVLDLFIKLSSVGDLSSPKLGLWCLLGLINVRYKKVVDDMRGVTPNLPTIGVRYGLVLSARHSGRWC